jgi:glutathione-independent formaldehyde dehydrogenase
MHSLRLLPALSSPFLSCAGGQAEYLFCPWADFNLLKMPRDEAMLKMLTITMLSDILPTGFDGAIKAKVRVGSIVYVAGAGPVGLCAAASCFLLGAAEVIVGDPNSQVRQQTRAPVAATLVVDRAHPHPFVSVSSCVSAASEVG